MGKRGKTTTPLAPDDPSEAIGRTLRRAWVAATASKSDVETCARDFIRRVIETLHAHFQARKEKPDFDVLLVTSKIEPIFGPEADARF
jgi:hypothetical protein